MGGGHWGGGHLGGAIKRKSRATTTRRKEPPRITPLDPMARGMLKKETKEKERPMGQGMMAGSNTPWAQGPANFLYGCPRSHFGSNLFLRPRTMGPADWHRFFHNLARKARTRWSRTHAFTSRGRSCGGSTIRAFHTSRGQAFQTSRSTIRVTSRGQAFQTSRGRSRTTDSRGGKVDEDDKTRTPTSRWR